ncbi:MAG: Na(+)/H(+) antiporter subunit D [Proteobacteria bacterium]|nr:Na(+)/H(+) antiporter subunit D [Pseudomonadota bacterium]MCP4919576.1 Na(+)/H(+) antiporter subunit D [Pseudomonadota bacterium]
MGELTSLAYSLPPGLILVFGAIAVPFLSGAAKKAWMLLLPLLGLAQIWLLPLDYGVELDAFGYVLEVVRVDKLSRIFGTVFHLAAFLSVLFALRVKDDLQHVTAIAYAGGAIGAVFAGDLITLFVYWELTAVTSVFLVWASRTERSYKTGMRYLVIQVLSGVLLLAGTLLHYADTGSLAFDNLGLVSTGTGLILLAFGIKSAFPFLHNWLQDAYPESTPTGTVWLSAFSTKLAIYALARGYAGTEILIPIGAAMTAFPVFFAVIENDLRKVLAYSLNNQLGFMVVGVGIGTELAINGAAAHAFAHIVYKGLLFMSMGAVMQAVGTTKASELGGLWRKMPFTATFCIIGGMAISAFPLFSGFVTKSMILTAAAEEHHTVAFFVLLFASAGVLDHSGIKVPYFAFFAHESKNPAVQAVKGEAPLNMLLAMAIAAFLCIAIGVFPSPLYDLLPYPVAWTAYDMTHVVTQLQLLLFAILAFVFLNKVGWYPDEKRATILDTDWVYRKAAPVVVLGVGRFAQRVIDSTKSAIFSGTDKALAQVARAFSPGTRSLGEPWPSGTTAAWAAVILAVTLLVAYFAH